MQRVIRVYGYGEAGVQEPYWKPPARPIIPRAMNGFDAAKPPGFLQSSTHPFTTMELITKARTFLSEECKKWAVSGNVEEDSETLGATELATRYKAIITDVLGSVQSAFDWLQAGQGIVWWMRQLDNELQFLEAAADKSSYNRRFSQEVHAVLERRSRSASRSLPS